MLTVAGAAGGMLLGAPRAAAAPLHVTGTAGVEASALLRDGALEVSGRLLDDRGVAVRGAEVRLGLGAEGSRPRPPPTPSACRGAPRPRVTETEVAQLTDDTGAFCLVFAPASPTDRVTVRFPGDGDHEASPVTEVPVLAGPRSVALGFAPTPRHLALDAGDPQIWVRAEVIPPGARPERLPLAVVVADPDGSERPVTEAWTSTGDRTAVRLPVAALGEPGRATLLLRFVGSSELPPATRRVVVEKTARVELALAEPPQGDASRLSVRVPVRTQSRLGPVSTGSVELRWGERTVGAAPVVDGTASPVARLDAPPGTPVDLTVQYLPNSPWWLAGEPLSITVAVPPAPLWRRWPWMVAGAGAALWVLRGWRRPRARAPQQAEPAPASPPGKPAVEVLSVGPAHGGWQGRVRDAHLGSPVALAEVAVLGPSTAGSRVLTRAVTDEEGWFQLEPADGSSEGAHLRVEAPWHSALERPIPASGELLVSLVTRRRAILDRLVSWAERVGHPWFWGSAEPTPGHVARVARERGDAGVAAWAEAAEAAAFGAEPVDSVRERAVAERAPPAHGSR